MVLRGGGVKFCLTKIQPPEITLPQWLMTQIAFFLEHGKRRQSQMQEGAWFGIKVQRLAWETCHSHSSHLLSLLTLAVTDGAESVGRELYVALSKYLGKIIRMFQMVNVENIRTKNQFGLLSISLGKYQTQKPS